MVKEINFDIDDENFINNNNEKIIRYVKENIKNISIAVFNSKNYYAREILFLYNAYNIEDPIIYHICTLVDENGLISVKKRNLGNIYVDDRLNNLNNFYVIINYLYWDNGEDISKTFYLKIVKK